MAEPTTPDHDMGIDVDELRRSMAAAGLRIVAGPGPLREVLPEAIAELTGEPLTPTTPATALTCAGCGRSGGELTENGCPSCGPNAEIVG